MFLSETETNFDDAVSLSQALLFPSPLVYTLTNRKRIFAVCNSTFSPFNMHLRIRFELMTRNVAKNDENVWMIQKREQIQVLSFSRRDVKHVLRLGIRRSRNQEFLERNRKISFFRYAFGEAKFCPLKSLKLCTNRRNTGKKNRFHYMKTIYLAL